MNIVNYTSYFHDGSLIDIKYDKESIVISMESAEISPDENLDNIALSERLTIKGNLHLDYIYLICEKEKTIYNKLRMLYDSAGILHFEIYDKIMKLDLEWMNFPPHPKITAYSFYTIHAEKIWWENIPDLHDPFW